MNLSAHPAPKTNQPIPAALNPLAVIPGTCCPAGNYLILAFNFLKIYHRGSLNELLQISYLRGLKL